MEKIIPGYFMPIWQDIMMSKRKYSIELISKLTLIPESVLVKDAYFYRRKEEYLANGKQNKIAIYFDYKYLVINLSKEMYKRIVLKDRSYREEMDFKKKNIKMVNICISFENHDKLIDREWCYKPLEDYLFLRIGVRYLKKGENKNGCLEKLLRPLIIDKYETLDLADEIGIKEIVTRYNNSGMFNDWYRTYKEYENYSYLVNRIISTQC